MIPPGRVGSPRPGSPPPPPPPPARLRAYARALIFTHLLNEFRCRAPTPYLSLNLWCLALVRPRSLAQLALAFWRSPAVGAALGAAGGVIAAGMAAATASNVWG